MAAANDREIWLFNRAADAQSESENESVSSFPEPADSVMEPYSSNYTFADHVSDNTIHFNGLTKVVVGIPHLVHLGCYYLSQPTASKSPSNCVHPGFYMNCVDIPDLDWLANVLEVPLDWKQRVDTILSDAEVAYELDEFGYLPDSANEVLVNGDLTSLLYRMGSVRDLGGRVKQSNGVCFGIGGFMTDEKCAIIGVSDTIFVKDGKSKFCTELKRGAKYRSNDLWYCGSRVAQSFGAMYYAGLPCLLCSPRAFKLIMETPERDQIHLYPPGNRSGDVDDIQEFGTVLCLLLMSMRDFPAHQREVVATPTTNRIRHRTPVDSVARANQQQQQQPSAPSTSRDDTMPDTLIPEPFPDPFQHKIFFMTPEKVDYALQNLRLSSTESTELEPAEATLAHVENEIAEEEQHGIGFTAVEPFSGNGEANVKIEAETIGNGEEIGFGVETVAGED